MMEEINRDENLTCSVEFNLKARETGKLIKYLAAFFKEREKQHLTSILVDSLDRDIAKILAERVVDNRAEGVEYTAYTKNVLSRGHTDYTSWQYTLSGDIPAKVILRTTKETFDVVTDTYCDSSRASLMNEFGEVTKTEERPLPTIESDREGNGTIVYIGRSALSSDKRDMFLYTRDTEWGKLTCEDLRDEVRKSALGEEYKTSDETIKMCLAKAFDLGKSETAKQAIMEFLQSRPEKQTAQEEKNLIKILKETYKTEIEKALQEIEESDRQYNQNMRGDNPVTIGLSITKEIENSKEFKNFIKKTEENEIAHAILRDKVIGPPS